MIGAILDFILIRNRREIQFDDETEPTLDLHESIIVDKTLTYSKQPITIPRELAGRPHAIAKILYNDENVADVWMTFNGIANPLSIEENMVFQVPDLDVMLSCVIKPELTAVNTNKKLFNKKISNSDKKKILDLKKKYNSTNSELKTTNMVANGAKATTKINNVVIYGTDIVSSSQGISNIENLSDITRKNVQEKLK